MSGQDPMASPREITAKLRERTSVMLGAAMEEAAILDVVVETLQVEVQRLRSTTEMLAEQASQARSLLQTELERADSADRLLRLAFDLLESIPESRRSQAWALAYVQWRDAYAEFRGEPDPLIAITLPQSSKGESALTTSPEE